WANLEASGIDFGVAPVPSVDGQPSKSFVGVLAANINAASPNRDLAIEFIENYLLTDEGLQTIDDDVPLGAVADKSFAETLADDEHVAATLANAQAGVPMPSTPATGKFWAAMGPALTNITSGAPTVDEALNEGAQGALGEWPAPRPGGGGGMTASAVSDRSTPLPKLSFGLGALIRYALLGVVILGLLYLVWGLYLAG